MILHVQQHAFKFVAPPFGFVTIKMGLQVKIAFCKLKPWLTYQIIAFE